MSVQIVVHGAAGRMGRQILELAAQDRRFQIVGAVETAGHPQVGQQTAGGVRIVDDLASVCDEGRVLIDFSQPSAAVAAASVCRLRRMPVVTGTTGFSPEQAATLREASEEIPVFHSPNMALGMHAFACLMTQAARLLRGYDIEISETHHAAKKDAPSGTALRIAELLCKELGLDPNSVLRHGRHGLCGPRRDSEIGVHALRLGDVVGEHTVFFAAAGEVLTFTHRCHSRAVFARGALEAALFVSRQPPGLYDMESLLARKDKGAQWNG